MRRERSSHSSWNVKEALAVMQAQADPSIWEQGQELFRRGAVEDFQVTAEGTIQVWVLDPRDQRKFFVRVERESDGRVKVRCACPYRLNGHCRHQVAGLEYLRAIAEGQAPGEPAAGGAAEAAPAPADAAGPPRGSVLYRLRGPPLRIAACPDGSLLRLVLHSLGSRKALHRVGLQLFTGSGWTELRAPDVSRWIARGEAGPHPRDAALAALLAAGGPPRGEVDSEALAALLSVLAESGALVTRTGEPLLVSRWPWTLAARLVRGSGEGLGIEVLCRAHDGRERPFAEVGLVPSAAPWIQLEDGAFHPLIAGAPGPALLDLQEEDLAQIAPEDLDRLLTEGLQELERICPGGVETEPGLIEEVEGVDGARIRLEGGPRRLAGKLELSYGGEWVEAPQTPEAWTLARGGKVQSFPPAGRSLARAHRDLERIGFRREEERWVLEGAGALAAALRPREKPFVRVLLPEALEPLNLVERAPVLRLAVELPEAVEAPGGAAAGPLAPPGAGRGAPAVIRRSGIAWLEVSFRLSDGERELPVDLAAMVDAARGPSAAPLELTDGTVLAIGHPSVRSLLDLADRSSPGGKLTGRLRVPISAIGDLLAQEPGREVEFAGGARRLVEGLSGGAAPAAEERPLGPHADALLRSYQREAARWMGHLASFGLGGILADEMGLGKTVMALAHLFGREGGRAPAPPASGDGPPTVLVVAPSSLIFNWLDECRRFFPGVEATGLYGEAPPAREEKIRRGADLLVTSYALLRRDREALEAREFRAVVLDEGQHVKNPQSQTAQAAFALRSAERWILTGTPVENHLGELWSLFHFLRPGFLGEREEFDREFAEPIARKEEEAGRKLRTRVRPFVLRRTKAQVLTELPPRIDQVERVAMSPFQERLYRAYLEKARGELEESEPSKARFAILAALTRLRQICCHPRLVLDAREEPAAAAALGAEAPELSGGKFELCLELLEECREEGHRVLLYSQFTSLLDLIEERLDAEDVPRCRLDGSTRDREGEVKRFARERSIPLFLISLKAGGFGLNLTQADTVILYDPWWNPAAEEQAAARAHRMGQTLPVHVHKLITLGTVEEKILELQERKRDLLARVVEAEGEPLAALDLEELRGVLLTG